MATKILRPYVIGTLDQWQLGAGATKVIACDSGDPLSMDTSTHIDVASSANQYFKPDTTFAEQMSSVSKVTVRAYVRLVTGPYAAVLKFLLYDSLGYKVSTAVQGTGNYAYYAYELTLMSNDSTPWSESAIRDSSFEWGIVHNGAGADWLQCAALWAEVEYVASPVSLATTFPRITSSQMIHEMMMRHGLVTIDLPLHAMNLRNMEDFLLSHPEGPHPDGEGWKDLIWERRLLRLMGIRFDPDSGLESIKAFALDMRKYATYLRDTAVSPYTIQSDEEEIDGPLRLDPGITRTMTRATVALAEDIGGEVVQLSTNVERVGPNGILIEDMRKNFAQESSFKTWTGGAAAAPDDWTEVDGDANLTISQETNDLFDAGLSTYACKLVSANGSGGDYGLDSAASFAWEEDDNGVLSIDHEDHTGQALSVRLQRSDDSEYWNSGTGEWQAGSVYHAFDAGEDGVISRDHMPFDMGGTTDFTGTFIISIRVDLADQECTIYHVQLEGGTSAYECGLWYPTSRIITATTSAGVRNADELVLSTNPTTGRRIIHPDHGTLFCRIKVDYDHDALNDADMATARRVAILMADMFTVQDFFILYNTVTSRFSFIYRTVTATSQWGELTAGEHVIAVRWISTNGELGLPSLSIDIFVDGTKGTNVSGGAARTEDNAAKNFHYGEFTSGYMGSTYNRLNGWISRIYSTPMVLTDEEVKAWMDRTTT